MLQFFGLATRGPWTHIKCSVRPLVTLTKIWIWCFDVKNPYLCSCLAALVSFTEVLAKLSLLMLAWRICLLLFLFVTTRGQLFSGRLIFKCTQVSHRLHTQLTVFLISTINKKQKTNKHESSLPSSGFNRELQFISGIFRDMLTVHILPLSK